MFESQIAVASSSGVRTAGPTWDEIDRRLRGIAARRSGLDLEEARWLLVARREGLHRHFGYARLEEYMERVLGYGPHTAAERLRVAERWSICRRPAPHSPTARSRTPRFAR